MRIPVTDHAGCFVFCCHTNTQCGFPSVYRPADIGFDGGSWQTGLEDPGPTAQPDQRGQDVGSTWSWSTSGSHHNTTHALNGGTTDSSTAETLLQKPKYSNWIANHLLALASYLVFTMKVVSTYLSSFFARKGMSLFPIIMSSYSFNLH